MSFIVLQGHYSPETAFVVPDYPYGFRLRCTIRYWLEVHPKKGTRLWSQTTNPKRGDVWNTPKASTYSVVGVLLQHGPDAGEQAGHVTWTGLSSYDSSKAREWLATYRTGLLPEQVAHVEQWADFWERHEAARAAKVGG